MSRANQMTHVQSTYFPDRLFSMIRCENISVMYSVVYIYDTLYSNGNNMFIVNRFDVTGMDYECLRQYVNTYSCVVVSLWYKLYVLPKNFDHNFFC